MPSGPSVPAVPSWAARRYGIEVTDGPAGPWSVGLSMNDLTRIALRRNPKRAQLLVSTVLGKHLPVDPRVVAGTGRLLGALVAARMAGEPGPPAEWAPAAAAAVRGADPDRLTAALPGPAPAPGVVTLGFAETATSLGHLVADQLGAPYLHSTRRADGPVPVAAGFVESHSHATDHLLRPDGRLTLAGDGPLVLVDDELSTGRTALNVIEALHARYPRPVYVLAGLVDVRSLASDGVRAELADRLGCRIDVVALTRGAVRVPDGTAERVARDLDGTAPGAPAGDGGTPPGTVRAVSLPWPARLPHGGRHGFVAADRVEFDATVRAAADALARHCGDARRVLVLGTEELMYLPLRLALALRTAGRATAFQSTTRSPVHAIDEPGYPIRRRIDFTSAPEPGSSDRVGRHVYNAGWPDTAGGGEADLIVVVDDGHAVDGPAGVAASVARATRTPVVLTRLTAVAG
ncbi:phosphoribosyltransferase domain-containing protein [Nakamurella sp.]|uniref:phosphoribosyltransferase domain-containing protein n=1 Tax=Nakamurella sp. TaxID=1869182 RepID=UPI003B3B2FD1